MFKVEDQEFKRAAINMLRAVQNKVHNMQEQMETVRKNQK